MNNDLISRSELKKALKSNCDTLCNDKNTNWCEHCCPLNDFEDLIDNAPTVNLKDIYQEGHYDGQLEGYTRAINEERPQGEWIKWNFKTFGAMGDWEYKCSNCEKVYGGEYNYCPNCGADMRKGESE